MQKATILFFLNIIISSTLFAQQTKQRFKVMHSENLSPIPYVSIQVLHKNNAMFADETGFAMLDVSVGDTLTFQSIGYYPTQVIINNLNMPPVIRVMLTPKQINLKEVTIKGIRTKDELKMAILRMRIEEQRKDLPGIKSYHGPLKQSPAGVMSPITLIYETEWAKKQRAKKWAKTLIMPQIK